MERLLLTSSNTDQCLTAAVKVLAAGGLVIYPTETMYGVGSDAQDTQAVTKLLHYKQRPAGKAISVLLTNEEEAAKVVSINESAHQIFTTFIPGPVTVVCADKGIVDSRLASEFHTLGIRVSSHPFAAALAKTYGKPITSTSANAAGAARPYSIDHLLERLSASQKKEIDLIIDAGNLPKREPSTVIDTTTDVQTVVRAGALMEGLAKPFISHSEEETAEYAQQLLQQSLHALPEKAVVFAIEGEMGMGKTQFAKGIARGLGISQIVTSPTYTLVKEYPPAELGSFVHMDLWRLEKVNPEELGLEEYLRPKTVVVIEWASPILEYLKSKNQDVVVHRLFIEGNDERKITLHSL